MWHHCSKRSLVKSGDYWEWMQRQDHKMQLPRQLWARGIIGTKGEEKEIVKMLKKIILVLKKTGVGATGSGRYRLKLKEIKSPLVNTPKLSNLSNTVWPVIV